MGTTPPQTAQPTASETTPTVGGPTQPTQPQNIDISNWTPDQLEGAGWTPEQIRQHGGGKAPVLVDNQEAAKMGGQVGEAMGNVQQSGSPQATDPVWQPGMSSFNVQNPSQLGGAVNAVGPDYTGQGSQISTETPPADPWADAGVDWTGHNEKEARLNALDPTGALVGVKASPYQQGWKANNPNTPLSPDVFDYDKNRGVATKPATSGEMGADWAVDEGFDDYEKPDPWEGASWKAESFVPAFMEVYSDLLKSMSPHEAGNLAASVFLKMTR
jgi:hypothetical protein